MSGAKKCAFGHKILVGLVYGCTLPVAKSNLSKAHKTRDRLWGFEVIDVDTTKKFVTMSVPICNCFHAARANSGKIITFRG